MTDLVSRLLEAIAAKEAKARAAQPGPWTVRHWKQGAEDWKDVSSADYSVVANSIGLDATAATVEFIHDNDPSSVLRRCAVDRKILELHQPKVYETDEWDENRALVDVEYLYCPRCWAAADYPAHTNPPERYPCDHVRLLSEAYGLEVTE